MGFHEPPCAIVSMVLDLVDMLMKMNCRNRVHAVALATREGLI